MTPRPDDIREPLSPVEARRFDSPFGNGALKATAEGAGDNALSALADGWTDDAEGRTSFLREAAQS